MKRIFIVMASDVSRYVVPPNFGDDGSINEALRIIKKDYLMKGRSKEVTLLIPTKEELEGTGIDASLGEAVCKKLNNGDKVAIDVIMEGEIILQCKTMRTFKPNLSDKTILCIYPRENMLDLVDSVKKLEVAVVVPEWELEEIKVWLKTWNPIISGREHSEPSKLIDNPVVEEAMERLTKRINLSTGLSNPRDKGATVELLRKLRSKKEYFDPDSLKAWALNNNWTPKGAEELRFYAQAIIDKKPVHGNKDSWESNIISEIRKKVSSK